MFGFLGDVAEFAVEVGVEVLDSGSYNNYVADDYDFDCGFDYEDNYAILGYDENYVKHDYNESKKDLIQGEIDLYIEEQITSVREKYEIDIFIDTTILELSTSSEFENLYSSLDNMKSLNLNKTPMVEVLSENTTFTTRIKNTKSNINELTSAIKLLKEAKNEFTA